ncbi:MAG: hypothetical protein QNJ41_10385 [Xenococcaceae cyanobacterium MO_188.B32]|nr:hypothetical protein [Xenococcaceae cyanobacterium MO_188.B32]
MNKAKKKGQGNRWSKKLTVSRFAEQQAQTLAQDVSILCDWLRNDILALAGPDYHSRRELWDFIVAEFKQREALCLHRLRPESNSISGTLTILNFCSLSCVCSHQKMAQFLLFCYPKSAVFEPCRFLFRLLI